MKKTIVVISSLAILLSFSAVLAKAQEAQPTDDSRGAVKDKLLENRRELKNGRDDLAQKKEELRNQRCAAVQEKVSNRVSKIDTNKEKHMAVYTNMVNRVQKFIDRLKTAGVETGKVETDLATLKEKIAKFSTDLSAYQSKLALAKGSVCGKSGGEFAAMIKGSRQELVLTRTDAQDIRTYMRTTVVPDILALKKQKALTNAEKAADEPKL
jgi:hypothetical protein